MSSAPDWLPEPLRYEEFQGDWSEFLAAVYEVFVRDFKQSKPYYEGHLVTHDARTEHGKEAAFWHITSSADAATQQRLPDLRRCERVSWIRPIIEHAGDEDLKVWREPRRRGVRIHLWLEQLDYLIVLAQGRRVMILVSAYCVDSGHARRNLTRRWRRFAGKQTPPRGTT